MVHKLRNRFQFYLERLLLRGAHYRLLIIAAVIGLVSVCAGGMARYLTNEFSSSPEAFWWAFLRLTDPGYLGDDRGVILRLISTIVTVLGYVLFLGSLVAIMTQWLNHTIERLEEGLTPVSLRNHIVILGWTNRTPAVIRELINSESRVKHFLQRKGARKLKIAVLAGKVSQENYHQLVSFIGRQWNERQVILRSGDALNNNHLMRVDFLRAAAIILPGADFVYGGSDRADMRTIKTLLSISSHARHHGTSLPFLCTELSDSRKTDIARTAYRGNIEIIASDAMISLLLVQNIRHPCLSYVYRELLTYGEGNEIRIRSLPGFAGRKFEDLTCCFPEAIALGVIRREKGKSLPVLNPGPGFLIQEDDRFVLMARNYEDTIPDRKKLPCSFPRSEGKPGNPVKTEKRLLLLGWNDMIPTLIHELDKYSHESFTVDIFSALSTGERKIRLEKSNLKPGAVAVRQLDGDYTIPSDLERIKPEKYDCIIILGCDWLETVEQADARTIVGFMLLKKLLKNSRNAPHVILELLDPSNDDLFTEMEEEIIVSPLIFSRILSHVTLRPEMNMVMQEIFGSRGSEMYFRDCREFRLMDKTVPFARIQEEISRRGETAMGMKISSESARTGLELNPDKNKSYELREGNKIVVLGNPD